MLPSVEDWLSASWADYRRRWAALMAVLALSVVAAVGAALLPFVPAAAAALAGAAPPWTLFGVGWVLSVLAVMVASAWGMAATLRAAAFDEGVAESLRAAWRQTPAFAWVTSLAMLAAGGGFVLLIVPGLILGVLVFFSPFYQLSGEASGLAAMELSFARVRPVLGAAAGRLALLATVVCLPSWIPWVGWIVAALWAPFGYVACARLADDLKALNPAPERPRLGGAVAALALVMTLATVAISWAAARAGAAMSEAFASGAVALPDAETAQSMLAVLQGRGTEDDARRSTTFVLTLSSTSSGGR
ncbi:MAG: hypothetical protein HYV14_16390 [Elusimicrobia bacterium]|nr:hypothetical protein [Elusimicrobiota bacterium]